MSTPSIAEVSGARALKELAQIQTFLQSKGVLPASAEEIGSLDGSSLLDLLQQLDARTAAERTSQMHLEHTEIFCMVRDRAYANRSRRWLWTRGYQTRVKRCYEIWAAFHRENIDQDLSPDRQAAFRALFVDGDPEALVGQPFASLLNLPTGEGETKASVIVNTRINP